MVLFEASGIYKHLSAVYIWYGNVEWDEGGAECILFGKCHTFKPYQGTTISWYGSVYYKR